MNESFAVKVGEFEGPLGLLLDLIERQKLHISEVSLASVAARFVEYLQALGERRALGDMADFIMVASTLMLIKSVSLLPNLALSEEERGSIDDLEQRLKLYQLVKHLSAAVGALYQATPIYFRPYSVDRLPIFTPSQALNLANLREVARALVASLPFTQTVPQVLVKKILSLEEVISDLARRVQSTLRLNFQQFVMDKKERVEVIISFLGLLELVKQGAIEVSQEVRFADISMESRDATAVPRY